MNGPETESTPPPGAHGPPPPEERRTPLRRFAEVTAYELCSSVLIGLLVSAFHGIFWLNTVVALAVLVTVSVLVWRSHPERVGSVLGGATTTLTWAAKGLACLLAGALVMVIVLLTAFGVRALRDAAQPCGQPLELRVMSAPEMLTPLRAAASEFVADRTDGGCRRYTVTVVPEPGPVALYDAFSRLWRRSDTGDDQQLLGPQPDVWIPATSAELDFVPHSGQADTGGGQTGIGGGLTGTPGDQAGGTPGQTGAGGDPRFRLLSRSLGTSPMVLALFPKADTAVASPYSAPLKASTSALLAQIAQAGVRLRGIARPVPDTSSAALEVTPALYDARPGASPAANEKFASPPDLVAPDAVTLLCRFRAQAAQGADPPSDVAVAVPEQVLADYDAGRALGDRCGRADVASTSSARWQLRPYYAVDLPTMDYPFVQLTWRGQDTRARTDAIGDLRSWLSGHPLAEQGLRDGNGEIPAPPEGDSSHFYLSRLQGMVGERAVPPGVRLKGAPAVQTALDRLAAARPKVAATLMLDVSGSMDQAAGSVPAVRPSPAATGPASGGTRLNRAVTFLQSLVEQLQGSDRVGLQVFSSSADPRSPVTFGNVQARDAQPDQKDQVANQLQAITTTGGDLALRTAISGAGLSSGREDLILVTDGESAGSNPGLSGTAAWLAGPFRSANPNLRLTVVLTGPAGCGTAHIKQITSAMGPGRGSCVALTGAPEQEQAAQFLSGLR
ncbi:vWA domain-containing protein [Actinomadura harenae]|uniref:VWA domain-containing protein n=1 Tax=Actinomadura harenae TaxID=2483351 RepID=A0A3M2MB30_9ACTN|nr:vWA domain-containing protein [Actinomadura harenae]RMI44378.1 VWA domain-containing protein [Actinomadura harenae]